MKKGDILFIEFAHPPTEEALTELGRYFRELGVHMVNHTGQIKDVKVVRKDE